MKLHPVGAHFETSANITHFSVWAPLHDHLDLVIDGDRVLSMEKDHRGYFQRSVEDCPAGTVYRFRLGEKELADPASRWQPQGAHGPSAVFASEFQWSDQQWQGIDLADLVIYELHTGTFSASGDFAGIGRHLNYLKELGVTAIEIMPVAQFPGAGNWGYDGIFPFAAQNTYGGPTALKELVNRCHRHGLAVILDVVYNHLGPEGNVLANFGPYYRDKYHTPWGPALNFDGSYSDGVRTYFLSNVRQWLEEFHFDGLRLDAIHAIYDQSALPFLEQVMALKDELQTRQGRRLYVIAETDSNDSRLLMSRETGGTGMDGHWNDDFHHSLHTLLTGESGGYYKDFGQMEHLARTYRHGVCYDGIFSAFHQRLRGRPYKNIERRKLLVCTQNHDQIGNRCFGERLSALVPEEALKLAAACLLLSPFLPLLFMGEESAAREPFLYFVDHQDPQLIEAVRRGRKEEFVHFAWDKEPPDPASEATFRACQLDLAENRRRNPDFFALYQALIERSKWLRRTKIFEPPSLEVRFNEAAKWLHLRGRRDDIKADAYFNFSAEAVQFSLPTDSPAPDLAENFRPEEATFTLSAYGFAFFQGEQS